MRYLVKLDTSFEIYIDLCSIVLFLMYMCIVVDSGSVIVFYVHTVDIVSRKVINGTFSFELDLVYGMNIS